jgi:hypothetical protein
MYVPLGEGNLNAGPGKFFEYGKIQAAANSAPWCPAYINPDEQLEIDGVVGIFHKAYSRFMGSIHEGFVLCGCQQNLFNLAWVGAV